MDSNNGNPDVYYKKTDIILDVILTLENWSVHMKHSF